MKWATAKLGELGSFRNGLNYTSANQGYGLRVINVADFKDRSVPEYDSLGEIDPQGVAGENDLLADGDIIFVRSNGNRDLVGRSLLIQNLSTAISHSAFTIRLRLDSEQASPKFLSYFFRSPLFRKHLSLQGAGTNICNLNQVILGALDVPIPLRQTQDSVCAILSAYDDAMENNRRRMALLEKAARLLYEEWFVRLRFPGHEHTPISNGLPQGWELGTIADFYDTTSGGTPSRSNPDFYTGEINWVKTQELNDDFIFETEERITEAAIEKSSAKVFPENTVLVSIYGGTNIGRTGVLAQPAASNQACCALFPKDPRAHFIYTTLYFREKREKLISLAQGAAQTNISQQVVRSLQILLPSPNIASMFIEYLTPVFSQLKTLKRQTQRLRAARDLLLPRLMSGEIEV